MDYFSLGGKISSTFVFAYTEGETPIAYKLIPDIIKSNSIPFELFLKKVTTSKKGLVVSDDVSELKDKWADYQTNNLAWPLMSERMKEIIDSFLVGTEGIVWMEIFLNSENEKRKYFIPRFTKLLDVINEHKTSFVKGTDQIIKPVFAESKIMNYSVFYKPQKFWQITSALYVNEIIKKALLDANLKGINFERILTE